jgi:hypothetical protein
MQPQPTDYIAIMPAEDLRTNLRNAHGTTSALNREIEALRSIVHRQKEQRDALLAACKAVFNWSQTDEDQPGGDFVHLAEVLVPQLEAAIYDAENPGTITIYNLPTCDVCGDGFTPEQWKDRHDGHEPGCGGEGCDCDLVYHAGCCPECGEMEVDEVEE